MNTSEGALKVAIHRLRKRYRELFRQEIADTVADSGEVESELRFLAAGLDKVVAALPSRFSAIEAARRRMRRLPLKGEQSIRQMLHIIGIYGVRRFCGCGAATALEDLVDPKP
jgi:hypothetical protein